MTIHLRRQDYYGRLGVTEEATPAAIRLAFRRCAKQFHPDVNASPEANDAFLAINEAYEVLRDEDRRRAYDDFRLDDLDSEAATVPDAAADDPVAAPPVRASAIRMRSRGLAYAWFAGLALALGIGGAAVLNLARTGPTGPLPETAVVEATAAQNAIEVASADDLDSVVQPALAETAAAASMPAPPPVAPAAPSKAAEPPVAAAPAPAPAPMPGMPPLELHADAPAAASAPPPAAPPTPTPAPQRAKLLQKPAVTPMVRLVAAARAFPVRVASAAPARFIRPVAVAPAYRAQIIAAQAARARLAAIQAYRARVLAWQAYRARLAKRWVPAWRGPVRRG